MSLVKQLLEDNFASTDGSNVTINLNAFINRKVFKRNTKDEDINIIRRTNQENRVYHVPGDLIPEFFKHYEACRRAGKRLYYSARVEPGKDHVCFKVDSDFLFTVDETSAIDNASIKLFIRKITKTIFKYFDPKKEDNMLTVAVFRRPECTYKEELGAYKYGLHIMFYFRASKVQRRFLIDRLKDDLGPELEQIFRRCKDKIKNLNDYDTIFDKGAISAPPLMYGSVKPGNNSAYLLDSIYEIDVTYDDAELETKELPDDANMAYETSLIYTDKIIKKPVYKIRAEYATECQEQKFERLDIESLFTEEEILTQFRARSNEADHIFNLLMIIPVGYADRREDWMKFLGMLAQKFNGSMEIGWKLIAKMFSRRSEKFSEQDFEMNWQDCVSRGYNQCYSVSNLVRLAYATKDENPERYAEMMANCVKENLQRQLGFNHGSFTHYNIAEILMIKFRELVFNDIPDGASKVVWGWFNTKSGDCSIEDKQRMYKWVMYHNQEPPVEMGLYMSRELFADLHSIEQSIIQHANGLGDDEEEKEKRKSYKMYAKQIGMTKKQLQAHGFKSQSLKECIGLFRKKNLVSKMDTDGMILGVPCGILEFGGPRVKFVDGFHQHLITKSTKGEWGEFFDPKNPVHKDVFMKMRQPFMDYEASAFWKVFFIICHGLTDVSNFQKDLWFLGGGGNAKTTISSTIQNTFDQYCKTIDYKALASGKSKGGNSASPELAAIVESRIAIVAEMPKGTKYDEALVKNLTGGENISYRRLYQDRQQRRCNSTIIYVSNHAFDMTGVTDYGNWRRHEMYTFKKKFVPNPDPDNEFEEKLDASIINSWIHKPEVLSGFLSMLVAFWEIDRKINNGNPYNFPSPIMEYEKQQFRNSCDHINEFISKRVMKPTHVNNDEKKEEPEKVADLAIGDFCKAFNEWSDKHHGNVIPENELITHFKESQLRKNIVDVNARQLFVRGCRPLTKEEIGPGEDEMYFLPYNKDGVREDIETPEQSWERFCGYLKLISGDDNTSDDGSADDSFKAV